MKTLPLLLIVAAAAAAPAFWLGQTLSRSSDRAILEAVSTGELLRALDARRSALGGQLLESEPGGDFFADGRERNGDAAFMGAGEGSRGAHLIERDLQSALAAAPGTAGLNTRLETLFNELAAINPELALDYAAQISGARQQRATINSILRVWAGQDGAAALAWYANTSEGLPLALREERLQSILAGYSSSDAQSALDYVAAMEGSGSSARRLQMSAYQSVFDSLVESGRVNLALDTLASVENASMRGDLQLALIQSWGGQNPEAVARYLDELGENVPPNGHATLVRAWAELDPARAAAHVSSLGAEHSDFGRAAASVVAQWTQYDIAGPGEWLNSLPASPEVDRSVAIYTARAAREDPEGAMSWASSIQNDRLRSWMMERVAGEWRQVDQAAFNAFVDAGDWTDEQRERLVNASAGDDRRRGMGGGRAWQ